MSQIMKYPKQQTGSPNNQQLHALAIATSSCSVEPWSPDQGSYRGTAWTPHVPKPDLDASRIVLARFGLREASLNQLGGFAGAEGGERPEMPVQTRPACIFDTFKPRNVHAFAYGACAPECDDGITRLSQGNAHGSRVAIL